MASEVANGKGRVLVVDDDPGALQALSGALGALGYEVWEAGDGSTALALAAEHQPDVILLDVVMPGIDGYEVCRRLKGNAETRLIPVVFLTGQGGREARLAGLDAGAADFLNKPCELAELEVRVRNLVSFRRLTEELDSAEEMMFTIARAVEARDQGTGDHCDRLARLTVRLGETLGLAEEELTALRRGSYMHDIGKVGIPDAVLLKPGPLTPEERSVMQQHVEIGTRICSTLRTLRSVLPIIRHHHERLDGSGYPDGLAGEEIPYLARVFQVVDVYDALSAERCYRPALTPAKALSVLREETELGWWDPGVVEVFCSLVCEDGADHGRGDGAGE